MHSGKTECAGAIATRVGKLIAKQNSTRLCKIDPSSNTKDLWDEVRRLTVSSAPTKLPNHFTAQLLNERYAAISQDPNYSQPIVRQSIAQNKHYVTEYQVFNSLDHLTATASGSDGVPFWFIRLLAPVISRSLTYLYNLSLNEGTVPSQWKSAVIHPIPKISNPVLPSDMRPISVTSILSRTLERLVLQGVVSPALNSLPNHMSLTNQFAYRPTCSTTAALITLFSQITDLLQKHPHVHLITFDYSKAFHTLSHSSVASKLSQLDLPDCIMCIYNRVE